MNCVVSCIRDFTALNISPHCLCWWSCFHRLTMPDKCRRTTLRKRVTTSFRGRNNKNGRKNERKRGKERKCYTTDVGS